MYDELIKRLREEAKFPYNDNRDLLGKATDAIEDLQKKVESWERLFSRLNSRLVEEKKNHRWIPTTERLPEHHGHYLVHIEGGEFSQVSWEEIAFFDGKIFMWEHISSEYPEDVTHWIPLPESPKDGE